MKRKMVIAIGCMLLLSVSTVSYCAEGVYLSGSGGYTILSDSDVTDTSSSGGTADVEFSEGYGAALAMGYDFSGPRFEGEISYQSNSLDTATLGSNSRDLTGDISTVALLFNVYYDIVTGGIFTPFIGVGVGGAYVNVNDGNIRGAAGLDVNDSDIVLAYQFGAGLGVAVSQDVSIDLAYRYFVASEPTFEDLETEYVSHNLYAGIRLSI